jgi:serine/threonine protein kinase
MEELGIEVVGDEQDKLENQPYSDKKRTKAKSESVTKDYPMVDEPIIDFRNRAETRRLARSVVGTSQYMAPEVIRGDMYDGRCD